MYITIIDEELAIIMMNALNCAYTCMQAINYIDT